MNSKQVLLAGFVLMSLVGHGQVLADTKASSVTAVTPTNATVIKMKCSAKILTANSSAGKLEGVAPYNAIESAGETSFTSQDSPTPPCSRDGEFFGNIRGQIKMPQGYAIHFGVNIKVDPSMALTGEVIGSLRQGDPGSAKVLAMNGLNFVGERSSSGTEFSGTISNIMSSTEAYTELLNNASGMSMDGAVRAGKITDGIPIEALMDCSFSFRLNEIDYKALRVAAAIGKK